MSKGLLPDEKSLLEKVGGLKVLDDLADDGSDLEDLKE